MKGIFITFEGADGAGKTTQIERLYNRLKNMGLGVISTREPGGTKISEKIRSIILDVENSEMLGRTEALLYAAARSQHVFEKILPALKEGKIALCDRFTDSTIAYQSAARGLSALELEEINAYAAGGLTPDVTIYLNLSPEEGIKRKRGQKELDRMELMGLEFHKKVCDGYKSLCEKYSRIKTIDASATADEIEERVWEIIEPIIKAKNKA